MVPMMFFNEFYKRATFTPIPPPLFNHLNKLKRTGKMHEIDSLIEDYNQQIKEDPPQFGSHKAMRLHLVMVRDHIINFKYKYYKKKK